MQMQKVIFWQRSHHVQLNISWKFMWKIRLFHCTIYKLIDKKSYFLTPWACFRPSSSWSAFVHVDGSTRIEESYCINTAQNSSLMAAILFSRNLVPKPQPASWAAVSAACSRFGGCVWYMICPVSVYFGTDCVVYIKALPMQTKWRTSWTIQSLGAQSLPNLSCQLRIIEANWWRQWKRMIFWLLWERLEAGRQLNFRSIFIKLGTLLAVKWLEWRNQDVLLLFQ